jgi:hypothetical protein
VVSPAATPAAPGGLRLVSDIESLLAENIPADALSLEDLAALLESIELRAELRKRKAQPPAAVSHSGMSSPSHLRITIPRYSDRFHAILFTTGTKQATQASSGDKKRLSIGKRNFPILPSTL